MDFVAVDWNAKILRSHSKSLLLGICTGALSASRAWRCVLRASGATCNGLHLQQERHGSHQVMVILIWTNRTTTTTRCGEVKCQAHCVSIARDCDDLTVATELSWHGLMILLENGSTRLIVSRAACWDRDSSCRVLVGLIWRTYKLRLALA